MTVVHNGFDRWFEIGRKSFSACTFVGSPYLRAERVRANVWEVSLVPNRGYEGYIGVVGRYVGDLVVHHRVNGEVWTRHVY